MKKLLFILLAISISLSSFGQEAIDKIDLFNKEVLLNSSPNKEQSIFKKNYNTAKTKQLFGAISTVAGGGLILLGVGNLGEDSTFLGRQPNSAQTHRGNNAKLKVFSGLLIAVLGSGILLSSTRSKKKIIRDYHDRQVLKETLKSTSYEFKMDSNKLSFSYQF